MDDFCLRHIVSLELQENDLWLFSLSGTISLIWGLGVAGLDLPKYDDPTLGLSSWQGTKKPGINSPSKQRGDSH